MSNFKLNLPTDIPWERVCVTEDMIDRVICDNRLPAKWQTSLAVFKYKPNEEYQLFPKYNISYLKITATLTGYQPLDKEIQGTIDWDGVDVSTLPGLTDLLNSYHPCHGAILQVAIAPKGDSTNILTRDFPFFMDFEPKKRELYELATDTKEKSSRSIETLNTTKSAGSTQSTEVLDIDMGGSTGIGVQGGGAGLNVSSSSQGQWGTKKLNSDESMTSRSSEVGQEKRETYSYSTQLSQLYHLLDTYHLGTNRVVFFVQPRPHTLEEPSGFVKGPRPVEGIQEFFMVVAQLKEQEDFCISLRLDTSHLLKVPVMDYDRKVAYTDTALAVANLPTQQDHFVERKVRWHVSYGIFGTDDIYYKHFTKKVIVDVVYPVPDGYRVENYSDVINNSGNGFSSVSTSPDSRTLTIHAEANSSIWFQDEGEGACIDNCPPDTLDEVVGRVERQLQVNLISLQPIKVVGEDDMIMITTRGLCCCDSFRRADPADEFVVGMVRVPDNLSFSKYLNPQIARPKSKTVDKLFTAASGKMEAECNCPGNLRTAANTTDPKYTIRLANELSDFVKTETLKSFNNPTVKLEKFIDTDFFKKQLANNLMQFGKGRKKLETPLHGEIQREVAQKIAEHFGKRPEEVTRMDILSLKNNQLKKITGLDENQIRKLALSCLGITFTHDIK